MVVSDDEDAVEEFVSGKLQFNSSVRVDFNYPDGTWHIKNERVINNPAQQKGVHLFAKIQLEIFRHSGMIVTTIHMPAICLMVVNLVSLLYGFNGYVRFILLGLDLVTHFEFLLYLGQKIPPSGDDVPNVSKYFDYFVVTTGVQRCAIVFFFSSLLQRLNVYHIGSLT